MAEQYRQFRYMVRSRWGNYTYPGITLEGPSEQDEGFAEIAAFVFTARECGLPVPVPLDEIATEIRNTLPMQFLLARGEVRQKMQEAIMDAALAKVRAAAQARCQECRQAKTKRRPACATCALALVLREAGIWEETGEEKARTGENLLRKEVAQ